jgi:SAM-dependent methyltransferase
VAAIRAPTALLVRAALLQTGGMATDGPGGRQLPSSDPDEHARRLAGEALAAGEPTGWFEPLYAAAEAGHAVIPWDRGIPHQLLVAWARAAALDGTGRRALVVGCGLGEDAEFVATFGFDTVAFDVSASAIRAARRRFPQSAVHYMTADLLDPPPSWRYAFDLVVESMTFQALPDPPRREAIPNVGRMVAPGGTLLVIARARDDGSDPGEGPPWSLTRAEIDAVTGTGLQPVRVEELRDQGPPATHRWLAHYRRG